MMPRFRVEGFLRGHVDQRNVSSGAGDLSVRPGGSSMSFVEIMRYHRTLSSTTASNTAERHDGDDQKDCGSTPNANGITISIRLKA